MNFIKKYHHTVPKEVCDSIVNYYLETTIDMHDQGLKEGVVPIEDTFWKATIDSLKILADKKIEEYFSFDPDFNKDLFYFTHSAMMHHKPFFAMETHHDSELEYMHGEEFLRTFIILIYLNDEFENGELIFPLQKISIKPEKGLLVIFPTSFTHPHLTTPAFGSDRYVLRMSYMVNKELFLRDK